MQCIFIFHTSEIHECIQLLGTSHCADMYANKKSDPPQLIEARARIGKLVDKWIHEAHYKRYEHVYQNIEIEHMG